MYSIAQVILSSVRALEMIACSFVMASKGVLRPNSSSAFKSNWARRSTRSMRLSIVIAMSTQASVTPSVESANRLPVRYASDRARADCLP